MIRHLICLSMLLALTVVVATPAVAQIENELLGELNRIQSLVERTIVLVTEGSDYTGERVALTSGTENLHVVHLLLQGRFDDIKLNVASDAIASSRHAESFSHYQLVLEKVLAKLDALMLKPNFPLSALDELQEILKLLLAQRPRPIHGALPYRQLSLPMFTPDTNANITPAYSSENAQPTADDLQESPAVERSLEIVELARSLDWNPVRMYEWVVNNIATEWYWGAMKGARQTLLQGRGNDADQAALLVALMRASGYPARFIKGKIGLFPTVETGLQRLGLSNVDELMRLLQKAGIPYEPVIAGGRVVDVAFEHLWCEVYVPYSNYRGTVIDVEGKSWIPLDTSLKPLTSVVTPPEISVDNFDYASIVTQYLSARQSASPLAYLKAQLALHQNTPDFDFGDLLPQVSTPALKLDLLPASTQFKVHAVTGEFSALPPELLPMAQVTATDANGLQLYALNIPLYRLIDKPLVIDADPETTADQQLAAEYGGFETTPTYLLNLRPLLRLGSERVAVASSGLAMGEHYRLRLRLVTSTGATETETVQVVGGLAAIAVGSGENTATIDSSGLAAVDLMYASARKYNASWRKAEDLLAQLLRLPLVRPLPAVTIVGSSYNISWLDNRPYAMQWEGLFMDAVIRVVEPVTEPNEISRTFMRLSGLQGSWLEAATLFEDYQVPAIATADLFGRAIEAGIEVLSIDSSNLDTALALLPFADNVKSDIRNATNQGWSVSIPAQNVNYLAWNGIGYIKENPQSGEAGYMLTGGLAGAQTADIQWADDYRAQFAFARSEPPNLDPLAAADIVFLPAGDRQNGIVGKPVKKSISVLVVDLKGRPVKGALVTFRSMVGGGSFDPKVQNPVETDARGIASIVPILGTSTAVNANFALDEKGLSLYRSGAGEGEVYSTRISINTFTAEVESTFGTLSLGEEFKLNAYPDKLDHLKEIFFDSAKGRVNSYTGTFLFQAVDQYENPVSNVDVVYEALAPEAATDRALPTEQEGLRNLTLFDPLPCKIYSPIHGEWPSSKSVTVLSGHVGAYAAGFFGNTVDTDYTIKVSALGSSSVSALEFTMSTFGTTFGGEYYPTQLLISRIANIDSQGRTLDAVNVGETLKIPLITAVELLEPVYKMEKQPTQCTEVLPDGSVETYDCWDIVWKGIVNTKKVVDGVVAYEIVPKSAEGSVGATVNNYDGTYAAKFTAPTTPRLNHIEAVGEVMLKVPEVFVDSTTNKMVLTGFRSEKLPLRTVTLESGNEALFDVETEELIEDVSSSTLDFGIYGVEVTSFIEPDVTLLDQFEIVVGETEYGARAPVQINYTIRPNSYTAADATIDLYEKGVQGDNWQELRVGDKVSGVGSVTFDRGTRLDPKNSYHIQTVLNRGSEVEIKSEMAPLKTLMCDLDIDSDNNAGWETDGTHKLPSGILHEDRLEDLVSAPGKLLRPNLLDVDGDEVPGYADGIDRNEQQGDSASAPFCPLLFTINGSAFDPAEATVRFDYIGSDPANVVQEVAEDETVSYILPLEGGILRLWTKDGQFSRKVSDVVSGGDYLVPGQNYPLKLLEATSIQDGWQVFIEAVADGDGIGDQRIELFVDPDGSGPLHSVSVDAVRGTSRNFALIPDYDHNRVIDEVDRKRALAGDTYYFWINDDDDQGDTEGTDIPGATFWDPEFGFDWKKTNHETDKIDGTRDLVDFFPVYFEINELLKMLPPDRYKYRLSNLDTALNFAYTELDQTQSGDYLTDVATARKLAEQEVTTITKAGVEISDDDLQRYEQDPNKGVIIFEGKVESTEPLVLEVVDESGSVAYRQQLNLSLDGVELMFRHVNLVPTITNAVSIETGQIGELKAEGGEKSRYSSSNFTNNEHFDGFDAELSESYFVQLHGANVDGQDARGWHSEMFKRLYWSRSKSKFVGVTWYGHQGSDANYQPNVVNAFKTAAQFGQSIKLATNNAPVAIMAHSLGNMVVSSYLNDYYQQNPLNVTSYFMFNAAVALEAYLGDYKQYAEGQLDNYDKKIFSSDNPMVHSSWFGYDKRLGASEWHQLFAVDDPRRALTWRNRFADLPESLNYFNFYSTGEDVLATHNGEWPDIQLPDFWNSDLGRFSWVLQEKWKGRNLPLGSTDLMGWGFNQSIYQTSDDLDAEFQETHIWAPVIANNQISDNQLRTEPFFRKPATSQTGSHLFTLTVDHGYVYSIRDELLACALPSLTLVAGGEAGLDLKLMDEDSVAFNMNDPINKNGWPFERVERNDYDWRHSDIKNLAYIFVRNIFDKITVER